MRIDMITREMEREMEKYIVIIESKNSDQSSSIIDGKDALIQLESGIIDFMKDKKPGVWINIPEVYVSDNINVMNFNYKILKKYKIDRKPYINNYMMYGHNFYKTREKLMKLGFKLVDSYYNDEGNTTGSLLEKNNNTVGLHIPGLKPHPSMDDITIAFNEQLFDEIGRIFPYLWIEDAHKHPMFIKKPFRYCDLYNVE